MADFLGHITLDKLREIAVDVALKLMLAAAVLGYVIGVFELALKSLLH